MNKRISHPGSKARYKGDAKNNGWKDPYVYVPRATYHIPYTKHFISYTMYILGSMLLHVVLWGSINSKECVARLLQVSAELAHLRLLWRLENGEGHPDSRTREQYRPFFILVPNMEVYGLITRPGSGEPMTIWELTPSLLPLIRQAESLGCSFWTYH